MEKARSFLYLARKVAGGVGGRAVKGRGWLATSLKSVGVPIGTVFLFQMTRKTIGGFTLNFFSSPPTKLHQAPSTPSFPSPASNKEPLQRR